MLLLITEIVPTDPSTTTTKSPAAAAAETGSTESEADLQKSTPQAAPAKGNHLHIHRRIHVICVRIGSDEL